MAPSVQIPGGSKSPGREGGFRLGPWLSFICAHAHLHRQTSSSVLEVHHSHGHSMDGAQGAGQRCGLGGEQPAEHWGTTARGLLQEAFTACSRWPRKLHLASLWLGTGRAATPVPEAGTALITWSASRLLSPRDT